MAKLYPNRYKHHRTYKRKLNVKVSILLAAMLTLTGCSLLPVEDESLQPPLVQPAEEELDIVEATRGNIETSLRGTANFVSASSATLFFKENGGRLKSMKAKVGEEVKAGELLAELETDDLDLQIRLQKLNVERARLLYKEAQQSGLVKTELRLREIDMEREELQLDNMEKKLSAARIYAPISGIVTFTETLNTGDIVSAYQTIITIADPSDMKLIYTASDSKDLLSVQTGMPVGLKYKGKDYEGTVLQSPAEAPQTTDEAKSERNSVTIIIGMKDAPSDVKIGHSAELTIKLQSRENVILLPRSAIRSYMGRSYVQVAEGDQRKEVDVELGLTTPTQVEVVKGLEETQQVILNN
ncbi:efflux RND transporter periplasmic adaptor subunit [Paenibacillus polygoni]|uniref:Efflux RND transporter periplasmic adaptor subunit n=1 Tax=Paenibacillus polygoni TaxID=3050112 RepID=A0ABY8WWP7_9BACL|nr:efflux RND transporter periplasmic adaptor subunit [Paenibacillus polygoni]WIV17402.1 efflux RND transporter periplasmic adaptor subunit [Paenibacillus polygoni]